MSTTATARRDWLRRLFPQGIPRLWCPPITDFAAARIPDAGQIVAHLRSLSPFVGGLLVPGSTGEGWNMSDSDIDALLAIVLDAAQQHGTRVLIGILKTDTDSVLSAVTALRPRLAHPAVVGITICPPKGADLTQADLFSALCRVLDLGIPTALYQLPQVTHNELDPETVARLAEQYTHFLWFKDTSGTDRVARSGLDFGGVFLVRGAEVGGYATWPKSAGGMYDGFLLSSANAFAPELQQILTWLDRGETERAQALSRQLEAILAEAFAAVASLTMGNPFTNVNKLLVHLLRHGERFREVPMPLLYDGSRLPLALAEQLAPRLEALAAQRQHLTAG